MKRLEVSIHAPAWGATWWLAQGEREKCFNSRARVGRDSRPSRRGRGAYGFQFTRPRGARHLGLPEHPPVHRFNSRARVGRDAVS